MALNYSQLVVQIQDYTENTFTTTDMNNFIRQAEQRIYNTVQLPALRKNVTGTLSTGNKYLAMPADWLATFSLAVINPSNEYLYLLNKDVNFIRQSYSVLLYGSLLEAYTYMKGEKDVLDNYRARYDEAMLLLKQLGDGKDRQDAYRSGQVRYPVQ